MLCTTKILVGKEEAKTIRKALKDWRIQDEGDIIVNTASFPKEGVEIEIRCIGCKAEYDEDTDSRSIWNKPSRAEAILKKNGKIVDRIRRGDNSFDVTGFSSHAPGGYFGEWRLNATEGDMYFVRVEEESDEAESTYADTDNENFLDRAKSPIEEKMQAIEKIFNEKVDWPETGDAWDPYFIEGRVEEFGPLCRTSFWSHQGEVIEFAKVFTKEKFLNTSAEELLVQLLEEPVWPGCLPIVHEPFGERPFPWENHEVEKTADGLYKLRFSEGDQPNRDTTLYAVRTSSFAGDVKVEKFKTTEEAVKYVNDCYENGSDADYLTEMTGIYAVNKKHLPLENNAVSTIFSGPSGSGVEYDVEWRIL